MLVFFLVLFDQAVSVWLSWVVWRAVAGALGLSL